MYSTMLNTKISILDTIKFVFFIYVHITNESCAVPGPGAQPVNNPPASLLLGFVSIHGA